MISNSIINENTKNFSTNHISENIENTFNTQSIVETESIITNHITENSEPISSTQITKNTESISTTQDILKTQPITYENIQSVLSTQIIIDNTKDISTTNFIEKQILFQIVKLMKILNFILLRKLVQI